MHPSPGIPEKSMPAQPGPARAELPHRYRVFGLVVASALPLPALPRAGRDGPIDVEIAYGPVFRPDVGAEGYSLRPDGVLLAIPQVGSFLIRDGREIRIDPAAGASERNLRLFLLGSAFGAILHQRGLLPLHANAIGVAGGAAAFLGRSGVGKSTLAAWFADRGHAVLGDDVCVVAPDGTGRLEVRPGLARLRLKPDALERSGRDPDRFEPSFDDRDKFDVPLASPEPAEPLPLRAVYLLDRPEDAAEFAVEPLRGVQALEALVANTYRGGLVGMLGRQREHLAQCTRIAASTPVFAVRRSWRPERMDAENERLLEHAATFDATSVDA